MEYSILFIGAGRMAEALIAGLVKKSKEKLNEIYVINQTSTNRLNELSEKYQVIPAKNLEETITKVDVIVLAMPPGQHDIVLNRIGPFITSQFIVTVAAGIGPSYLEERLPSHTAVGWIMPNTAAMIGESMSLFTYGKFVSEENKKQMEMLVKAIGESQLCLEDDIHDLTAITGSAPAFVYLFVETLIDFTEKQGISKEIAEKLVKEMVIGSANMLREDMSPSQLREQVTTPGGATAEGLKVLHNGQFSQLIEAAIVATNKKAKGEA